MVALSGYEELIQTIHDHYTTHLHIFKGSII